MRRHTKKAKPLKNAYEQWVHILLVLEVCFKQALLSILRKDGLPINNKKLLFKKMLSFKTNQQVKLQKVIRNNQWDRLCPPISNVVNANNWDITLIIIIIQHYNNSIDAPSQGWRSEPGEKDRSIAAFVCRARKLRNKVIHDTGIHQMNDIIYDELLNSMKYVLNGLGYKDTRQIKKLANWKSRHVEVINIFHTLHHEIDEAMRECEGNADKINKHKLRFEEFEGLLNDLSTSNMKFSKGIQHIKDKYHAINGDLNKHSRTLSMMQSELSSLKDQLAESGENKKNIENLQNEFDKLKKQLLDQRKLNWKSERGFSADDVSVLFQIEEKDDKNSIMTRGKKKYGDEVGHSRNVLSLTSRSNPNQDIIISRGSQDFDKTVDKFKKKADEENTPVFETDEEEDGRNLIMTRGKKKHGDEAGHSRNMFYLTSRSNSNQNIIISRRSQDFEVIVDKFEKKAEEEEASVSFFQRLLSMRRRKRVKKEKKKDEEESDEYKANDETHDAGIISGQSEDEEEKAALQPCFRLKKRNKHRSNDKK